MKLRKVERRCQMKQSATASVEAVAPLQYTMPIFRNVRSGKLSFYTYLCALVLVDLVSWLDLLFLRKSAVLIEFFHGQRNSPLSQGKGAERKYQTSKNMRQIYRAWPRFRRQPNRNRSLRYSRVSIACPGCLRNIRQCLWRRRDSFQKRSRTIYLHSTIASTQKS